VEVEVKVEGEQVMEGLNVVGAKMLGKEGAEGGGGSGSGSGGVGGKDAHGNGNRKVDAWNEEQLCEGLRKLEEMHNKVCINCHLPLACKS